MSVLWNELHMRGLQYEGKNDYGYILTFGKRIPRYTSGCTCKEFWNKWIITNPPDYKNYFAWTVKTHNAVNIKLNKPEMSLEDARALYTPKLETKSITNVNAQAKPTTELSALLNGANSNNINTNTGLTQFNAPKIGPNSRFEYLLFQNRPDHPY